MRIAVTFACLLLKLPLTMRDRTKLVGAILEANNAVPLRDIITWREDGAILLDGEAIDIEKLKQLREGAKAMMHNGARKIIKEQVASIAGRRGIVEGDTPEKLYFYRAALWFMWTEEELYKQLGGE